MIAVIETGGKQYLVKSGDTITIEKLPVEPEKSVVFDKVLLTANDDGSNVQFGAPYVSGVTVKGTCVSQIRDKKIRVIKYKRKVRYRRAQGHRQAHTLVTIA